MYLKAVVKDKKGEINPAFLVYIRRLANEFQIALEPFKEAQTHDQHQQGKG